MTKLLKVDQELLDQAHPFSVIYEDNSSSRVSAEDLATMVKNPYELDTTSFLPQTKTFDLKRFFELTQSLVKDACKRLEQPDILFVEEYPPIDFPKDNNDVITYKLISRKPASLGEDGKSLKQSKFKFSFTMKREDCIYVKSRPLDHIVEFNVWSRTNKSASEKAIFLEKLLINHSWVFTSNGAEIFQFEERLSDAYQTHGAQRLFSRPLRFFLRYREFLVFSVPAIKEIKIALHLKSE